ncbi:hypothetical protein AMJ80_08975 [bacterium SM23_31]|nr:MAG: hypothetical protein AMJ80_08975 [bacterium SM23_31]
MNCALCGKKTCHDGKMCMDVDESFMEKYYKEENEKIFRTASKVEAEWYMKIPRLEEIIIFAKEVDYKHIGIAFCIGLEDEAKILCKILKRHFKVSSVCCKVCAISKDDMGVPKIKEGRYESMCNPIGQAHLLNESNTDLNIICGLCIGHDILFTKHSNAPVTTYVVKDRMIGHNPVSVLYSRYYKNIFLPK